MRYSIILLLFTGFLVSSCGWNLNAPDEGNGGPDPGDETPYFEEVSSTNLPGESNFQTNAVKAVDINNDNSLDIVLAIGLQQNKILINNSNGEFSDETSDRLVTQNLNSQDIPLLILTLTGISIFSSPTNKINPVSLLLITDWVPFQICQTEFL